MSQNEKTFSIQKNKYNEFIRDTNSITEIKALSLLAQTVKLGSRNRAYITQAWLSEKLRVKQQSISRTLVSLAKKNMIKKMKGGYMINPHAIIKEYEKYHRQTFAIWSKP